MKISNSKYFSGLLLLLVSFSFCRITESSTSYGYSGLNCPVPDKYSGPKDFDDIFKGTPTRPPKMSGDQGAKLAEDMISIGLGEIPVIGSIIKGFFDTFMGMYNDNNLQNVLKQFYKDLENEVKNLKLYVDEQIAELKVGFISDHFNADIVYTQHCTLEDAKDQSACVQEAYRRIVTSKVFLPSLNASKRPDAFSERELRNQAVVLERILPMLRHHGDLLIMTSLEVIADHYRNNRPDIAKNYENDLKLELTELISYLQKSQSLIELYSIANYDLTECDACPGQSLAPPWNVVEDYYVRVIISSTFGPGGTFCKLKAYTSTPAWGADKDAAQNPMPLFNDEFGRYKEFWSSSFKDKMLPQVRKYYETMFGKTLENWEKVLNKLGSVAAMGSLYR